MKYKILIFLFITVFILWILNPIIVGYIYQGMAERGQAGDLFGAVNSLFSGLAFAGIIWSLRLQQTQLEMQKEELKLQREEQIASRIELKGQKEQLQQQSDTFKLQRFENSFFSLLNVHRKYQRNMSPQIYEELKNKIKTFSNSNELQVIQIGYFEFYCEYSSVLDQYFKNLYLILKFLESSSNKNFYAQIISAQLSKYEKLLIFYHCLSKTEIEIFKPLVEKYSILEGLVSIELIDEINHYSLYQKNAFGSNQHSVI